MGVTKDSLSICRVAVGSNPIDENEQIECLDDALVKQQDPEEVVLP
jgi:hypothetical protein